MTVYADVLVFLNTVIDYLLISLTSLITHSSPRTFRVLSASVLSGLFSLVIYFELPPTVIVLIFVLEVALTTLAAYGYQSTKTFFRRFFCLLAVSVIYSGIINAIWNIFRPNGMKINNNTVYFDISALELLIISGICYGLIILFRKVIKRRSDSCGRCQLHICKGNTVLEITGIIDNGNSVKDIYTGNDVIIVDKSCAKSVLNEQNKIVLIPYKTVGGNGVLRASYSDFVKINGKRKEKVLIAVSNENFGDDYKAIVTPDILQ